MTEQQQPQPRIKQEPESAATFVATVRAEHDAMTQWYNNEDDTTTTGMAVAMLDGLHAKFGPVYPKVWKDVLNWSGWHETRQAYLLHSSSTGGITTTAVVEEQQQQVKMEDEQQQQQQHNTNNNNISHKKDDDAPPAVKKQRKSRWGTAAPATTSPSTTTTSNSPSVASTTTTTTNDTNAAMILEWQAELRRLNQRLESIPTEAARVDALPRNHRERSPSPPPVYGPDGKRQNTRAVRWKERFTLQRQDLLEKLLRHNSTLSGSGGGGNPLALVSGLGGGGMLGSSHNNNNNALSLLRPTKTTKKIPIPIEKHPNYNFIGLIIGPRGKTQKELEAKTGCKIAIRGKGSVKEGARGRRDGASDIGDYEPLHVVVSGDDPRAVQAASTMIADMLVVIDDERNVHKQQQLRELALLNGTLKDDETGATVYCPVCAEKGHRAFECPKRFATAGRGNNSSGNTNNGPTLLVQCAICGDTSHPTRDCKQQKGGLFQPPSAAPPVDSQQVDSDYQSFMAELESGPRDGGRGATSSTAIVSSTSSTNTMPVTSTSAPVDEKSMAVTLPVPGGEAMLPPPPPPPPPILPPVPLLPPPPQAPSQSLSSGYPYSNGNPPHQQSQQQQQQHHQMYPLPHHQQQQHSYSGHSQQQQQHSYYQQQQQHQPYSQNAFPNPPTDYPGHAASGPGFSHGPDNGGNNTNNNQQQQQQQVIVPGEETATWDPNAYYGSGNAATGAGGFNWWEQ